MKLHAFICTREGQQAPCTKELVSYLGRCKVDVNLLVGEKSIFEAYHKALTNNSFGDEDIVILCHDDIEILMDPKRFVKILIKSLMPERTGFVGVAGTRRLGEDAVWWNQQHWQQGLHRGCVLHGEDETTSQMTWYGNPGEVAVLDGLFLAAKYRTLRKLDLSKPDYFTGDWDFYDIHYTTQAVKKNYHNYVVPIMMLHHSFGELAGRDSWHQNRAAYIERTDLPLEV